VYRVRLIRPTPGAPFPFNQCYECIATNLEIETYGLQISEVIDGVAWKRTIPGDSIVNAIRGFSTWKQIGRCYWGRWGQLQKVECNAKGKRWHLPNIMLNVPWAHTVISRVKMRLWEYSKRAVHVYVDSVITDERIPTGDNIGDWRLEKVYESGVFVRGPGQYGALGSATMERYSGVGSDSPQRSTTVAMESVGQPSQ
jgi:hypothetical protein